MKAVSVRIGILHKEMVGVLFILAALVPGTQEVFNGCLLSK